MQFVWRTSAAWWCAQPGGEIEYALKYLSRLSHYPIQEDKVIKAKKQESVSEMKSPIRMKSWRRKSQKRKNITKIAALIQIVCTL